MADSAMSKETKTMRTQIKIALASMLVVSVGAIGAQGAAASFSLVPGSVDATALDEAGHFYPQAGGHPYAVRTEFKLNSEPSTLPGEEFGLPVPEESDLKNVI